MGLVSPRKAAAFAYDLFCTPYTGQSVLKAPPLFHKAEKLSFLLDGAIVRGFHWKPEKPNGKKILLAHGFSSCAYKFEPYVPLLLKEGFEVTAFDAPAHGTSDGKRINAITYKKLLLTLEKLVGPFYGIIGHSLGGLATSLAMEEMYHHPSKKMVLIAPATETSTTFRDFYQLLRLTESTKKEFEKLIVQIAAQPIAYFSVGRVVQGLQTPTLWVHDQKDLICPYTDTLPIQALQLPHLQFLVTNELGHNKIYRNQEVMQAIVQFLLT